MTDFTVAVFANGPELALVRLEEDACESAAAEATARGYQYAGSIGVRDGKPTVSIEAGFSTSVFFAGVLFAEALGRMAQDSEPERQLFLRPTTSH